MFDVFAAHRIDSVLKLLEAHNIKCVFIPASCTDNLDKVVNKAFKAKLKEEFNHWYAGEVERTMNASD